MTLIPTYRFKVFLMEDITFEYRSTTYDSAISFPLRVWLNGTNMHDLASNRLYVRRVK